MKNSVVLGTFRGKCCDSTIYNNNGMLLNRELFTNLMNSEDYKRAMENRYYIGFLGHPEDPNDMNFKNACIVMTDMEMLDNGEIWGTFDLIDTPVGVIVKAFIDAGVVFGISIRGAGDIDGTGKVDPETFVFRGYDLVTFPAYDDAVPEFREIAASTDIQKQSKYKKVCAAIRRNLSKINSCEALEIIQSQFDNSSTEFQQISNRMRELDSNSNENLLLLQQKLDAMTQLYLQTAADYQKLFDDYNRLQIESTKLTAASDRKIRSIERIMGTQVKDLTRALTAAENKYKTAVSANSRLKDANDDYVSACDELEDTLRQSRSETRNLRRENRRLNDVNASTQIQSSKSNRQLRSTQNDLSDVKATLASTRAELSKTKRMLASTQSELKEVKGTNLIYRQRIESTSRQVEDHQQTIKDLKSQLSETVTANRKLGRDSSNRDAEIENLQKENERITAQLKSVRAETHDLKEEIEGATQLIGEYQQAYADMFASAVGLSVEDIPVTSSTSPEQLKRYILGSTSTSGMFARPSVAKPEQLERIDEDYYGEMVTL